MTSILVGMFFTYFMGVLAYNAFNNKKDFTGWSFLFLSSFNFASVLAAIF